MAQLYLTKKNDGYSIDTSGDVPVYPIEQNPVLEIPPVDGYTWFKVPTEEVYVLEAPDANVTVLALETPSKLAPQAFIELHNQRTTAKLDTEQNAARLRAIKDKYPNEIDWALLEQGIFDFFGQIRDIDPDIYQELVELFSIEGLYLAKTNAYSEDLMIYVSERTAALKVFKLPEAINPEPGERAIFPEDVLSMISNFLLFLNGDRHKRIRQAIIDSFKRTAVQNSWEGIGLKEKALELLAERLSESSEIDFVQFGGDFSSYAITRLLGLTKKFWNENRGYISELGEALLPLTAGNSLTQDQIYAIEVAMRNSLALVQDIKKNLINDKTLVEPDGLVANLINTKGEDRLSENEMASAIVILLIGGRETMTSAISSAATQIALDPDLEQLPYLKDAREKLRADGVSNFSDAVNELFERHSVITTTTRNFKSDYETLDSLKVEGRPELDELINTLATQEYFSLRLDLKEAGLEFGSGIHHCVGMNLAKTELASFLEIVLGNVELAVPEGANPYLWQEHATTRSRKAAKLMVEVKPGSTLAEYLQDMASRTELGRPSDLVELPIITTPDQAPNSGASPAGNANRLT